MLKRTGPSVPLQSKAKQLEVGMAQQQCQDDPGERERQNYGCQHAGRVQLPPGQCEDAARGQRLGDAHHESIDEWLRVATRVRRQRHPQELRGRSMQGMPETAVRTLDQQHHAQGRTHHERHDAAQDQQQRQDRDGRQYPQAPQELRGQRQLEREGNQVQDRVVLGEKTRELAAIDFACRARLEHVVDAQERHGGDGDQQCNEA